MTKLLIGFAKKNKEVAEQRTALSNLSGWVCIFCNLLLGFLKIVIGSLSGALSITADAINNLSDCASNIVSLTGTKLSNKPVDKEHPFGHGRIEYISALIVSLFIFVMSFELAKSSINKIINPSAVQFSIWYIIALGAAIIVKLWMAFFNLKLFKLTDNLNMKALRQDSLNDCIATLSTIAALLISKFLHFHRADGIIGLGVSVFILISGIQILKEVISPLLGEAPSKELTEKIKSIILEDDIVLGVHDLIVHSYGAGKIIASADAEVNSDEDIFAIHDVIDKAERRILEELNIIICIHIDPIRVEDSRRFAMRKKSKEIIKSFNSDYSLHDFRLREESGKEHIFFDLTIPFEDNIKKEEIKNEITKALEKEFSPIEFTVNVENSYI
ncbi:MAG: cation transporter [Eubacterium sp.]|nr:cation transporter [Eubacterium sp.]